jgi:hypothetical protein
MKRLLASLIVVAAITASASACPMCKDSVSNREGETNELHDSYTTGGQNIANGLNVSVYVMLGTLFGMMGLVSTVIVRGVRSSSASRGFLVERTRDDQSKR